jgi:hypothetical protein
MSIEVILPLTDAIKKTPQISRSALEVLAY